MKTLEKLGHEQVEEKVDLYKVIECLTEVAKKLEEISISYEIESGKKLDRKLELELKGVAQCLEQGVDMFKHELLTKERVISKLEEENRMQNALISNLKKELEQADKANPFDVTTLIPELLEILKKEIDKYMGQKYGHMQQGIIHK